MHKGCYMKIKLMFAGLLFCASLQGMEGEPNLQVQHRHLDIKQALEKLSKCKLENAFQRKQNPILVINYVPVDRAVNSDAGLRAIIMHDMETLRKGHQGMVFKALLVTNNVASPIDKVHSDTPCPRVYNFSEKIVYDDAVLEQQFKAIKDSIVEKNDGAMVNIYGEVSIQKSLHKHFPRGEGKDYISMNKPGIPFFMKAIGGFCIIIFSTYLLFRLCR